MTLPVQVKICGLTRQADAQMAVSLGAWALGFIFYHKSPRWIDPERVARMLTTLNPSPKLAVGVFVNPTLDELQFTVTHAKINAIQLHGDESPAFCIQVKALFPALILIKAVRLETYQPSGYPMCDHILVDSKSDTAWGGTGHVVDWEQAERLNQSLILAGGLTAANVLQAINVVKPCAIDLSSGVEVSPGIKSVSKLQALFQVLTQNPQEVV